MTALLFAPHNDDEALFASFLIQRHVPNVVVCFKARKQSGVLAATREAETQAALEHLDPVYRSRGYEQWEDLHDDDDLTGPARQRVLATMIRRAVEDAKATTIICPMVEPVGGHPQHDAVGLVASLAADAYQIPLIRYATYRDGRGRSGHRNLFARVEPSGEEIRRKLLALAEYRSQHALWATAHHFLSDQNEWHG